jgi:hypothetical protein
MKKFLLVPALAAILAGPVMAEPVTKTVTIDRPNYDGTTTIVRDKDAGTLSRDTQVTRASDGATATREYDRARTADGFTASGSATNFDGETRSFERTRTRTDAGSTTSGSYTTRGGETYTTSGNRTRTDTGFTANQNIKDGTGATVFNRDVTATRADGQVTRSVDVTRAEGFRPPHRPNRPEGNHERRRRWNANH